MFLTNAFQEKITGGLVGNYNLNSTDDFILPNGTAVFEGQNATERQLFEEFGQKCKFH